MKIKQIILANKFLLLGVLCLVFIASFSLTKASADTNDTAKGGRLVTVHDRGDVRVILTHAQTVADALQAADVHVVKGDTVEPALDEQLVASDYSINVYRARPVLVIDGQFRQKVNTSKQSAAGVAKAAGLELHDEDIATLSQSGDMVTDGTAEVLNIKRATEFELTLYGKTFTAYTQAKNVWDMLKQKGVKLGDSDTVSQPFGAKIVPGMKVAVWRNGVQTVTLDEDIDFKVRQIQDYDHPLGYKKVETPGQKGKRTVSYEIHMQNGVEISRTEIHSQVIAEPKEQVETVGAKMPVTTTPSQNRDLTWQFLISKGLSREQVAGIMGNLMQEHGFNTSGDGLAQWTGSRKANLMSRENPYTIQTQLEFLWYELSGGYVKVLNNIRATSDTAEATRIFQNQFERCGQCAETLRINYALSILGSY